MNTYKKSRTGWWVAGGAVLVVLISVQLFISFYFNPLVRQRIQEVVINGSDSLYRIDLGSVNASFWNRSVKIKDLHIYTDNTRYQTLEQV